MKRVFGLFEVIFDIIYLISALVISYLLLTSVPHNSVNTLAGIMALILALGDSFHLIPRIVVILSKEEEKFRTMLGVGKQITSITMTIFYLILWHIGTTLFSPQNIDIFNIIIYLLAIVRILICLLPQNKWTDRYPPLSWGIWRNVPFFIMGIMVAIFFYLNSSIVPSLSLMWLAIVLSFGFYLPVVLWSNKNPKIGMLMLLKTCAYLWMISMFLSI